MAMIKCENCGAYSPDRLDHCYKCQSSLNTSTPENNHIPKNNEEIYASSRRIGLFEKLKDLLSRKPKKDKRKTQFKTIQQDIQKEDPETQVSEQEATRQLEIMRLVYPNAELSESETISRIRYFLSKYGEAVVVDDSWYAALSLWKEAQDFADNGLYDAAVVKASNSLITNFTCAPSHQLLADLSLRRVKSTKNTARIFYTLFIIYQKTGPFTQEIAKEAPGGYERMIADAKSWAYDINLTSHSTQGNFR